MSINDQIDFLYQAGETRRFHTWPVIRERTIAHHSWHVAQLLHILYGQEEPGIRPVLTMAALAHDMAECKMGDLPSPGKRAMSEHFENFRAKWGEAEEKILSKYAFDWDKFLDDEERRKLKFCDNLEGALYCINERQMGNKLIAEAFWNFYTYLTEIQSSYNTEVLLDGQPKTIGDIEFDATQYVYTKWGAADAS